MRVLRLGLLASLAVAMLTSPLMTGAGSTASARTFGELRAPYQGFVARFGGYGGDAYGAFSTVLRGGFGEGMFGAEVILPMGGGSPYDPKNGDSKFMVGNVGVGGRFGHYFNAGVVGFGLGASATLYTNTGQSFGNIALLQLNPTRPGMHVPNAWPLELAISAEVYVAIITVTAEFGTTFAFTSDEGAENHELIHGSVAAAFGLFEIVSIDVDLAFLYNTRDDAKVLAMLGTGVFVQLGPFALGGGVQIPLEPSRTLGKTDLMAFLELRIGKRPNQ